MFFICNSECWRQVVNIIGLVMSMLILFLPVSWSSRSTHSIPGLHLSLKLQPPKSCCPSEGSSDISASVYTSPCPGQSWASPSSDYVRRVGDTPMIGEDSENRTIREWAGRTGWEEGRTAIQLQQKTQLLPQGDVKLWWPFGAIPN